jgi:hypothetical protein
LLVIAAANRYLGPMIQYITVAADDRLEPRNGIQPPYR